MWRLLVGCLIFLAPVTTHGDEAAVHTLQQALFELGFYTTGPVDGRYGPRTEDAIRRFQASLGATPTGVTTTQQTRHALDEARALVRPRFWPVDESARDPAFEAFRTGLRAAVAARDLRGVATFFADDVLLDFGGGSGRAELIHRLSDGGHGLALWSELETILGMGSVQTAPAEFCLPYVWCAPRVAARVGAEMSAWVVERTAVLRAGPHMDAEVVELLRYDVLEILGNEGDWACVETAADDTGWLHRSQYRTPYDFRILAGKRDGRWQVTVFVAGD